MQKNTKSDIIETRGGSAQRLCELEESSRWAEASMLCRGSGRCPFSSVGNCRGEKTRHIFIILFLTMKARNTLLP
ncbi:hypothetical protein EYF80_042260 [Liparis tanakae]|uniref:Uncharacterized protein n=1 Tax=Liparis tanakae TaxID=230148 RepID=A0A4Z2G1X6_9TELE|nr:hypothetical protein EYF80_042260 [Liparis tanakae]